MVLVNHLGKSSGCDSAVHKSKDRRAGGRAGGQTGDCTWLWRNAHPLRGFPVKRVLKILSKLEMPAARATIIGTDKLHVAACDFF